MDRCRCCGKELPEKNLLLYRNMPKSAQFFPTEEELENEKGLDIVLKQCPYCGLVQAIGEPVPYFRDVIRASGFSDEMMEFRRKQYSEWMAENNLESKKVIEIGCGKGEYMTAMETAGCIAFGLEHSDENILEAKKAGHNVIKGFIENEDYRIKGAPYDGFYIMNFLEHIPEPGGFIRGIANNLRDGAVGIVEVPNFDMILEESLYSEFIQDHVSYFTKDTLENILRLNGFEVLTCESIWYGYILSAKVRKRSDIDVLALISKENEMNDKISGLLKSWRAEGKKVAAWGAGHQALANFSLLGMSEYLECVIDSAPFKQGKYTPATHLPVVSSDVLKKGEIDVVIVMAGGYSDEIMRIIEREYPGVEAITIAKVAEGFKNVERKPL
ncbi:Methyltransferase domain-containing protein [Butyrivibrio sp. ob235]|uniref:class I SAM-dependent methyltransferase n=1 Tax=Butyrivibrio sp. ob235 TaxID=1761780 RepID=UPI0008C66718|nr:class I SAM-dependent methyltransferase [Butyrivibrio sp. ob235]SEM24703.1 Methyltransferase domain-containing protein [Butyrivibrio sp. ob235]